VVRCAGLRIGSFAQIHRQKGDGVVQIGSANLNFSGAVWSGATDDRAADGI